MKDTCNAVYFLEQVYETLQCCLGRQLWNSVNDIWLDRNTEMHVVSEVLLSGLSLVLKFMMNGLHPGHLGSAAEGLFNLWHFLQYSVFSNNSSLREVDRFKDYCKPSSE